MNSVYRVSNSKIDVIVRVFTSATHKAFDAMASQVVVGMRAAHLGGIGADVLASFNNGIVYTFQEGEQINPTHLSMDKTQIRKLVRHVLLLDISWMFLKDHLCSII